MKIEHVINRDGKSEKLDPNQINIRIEHLAQTPFDLTQVNVSKLSRYVIAGFKDGMKTSEIDKYAAEISSGLGTLHYEYLTLAGRIAVDDHQKNTLASFSDKIHKIYRTKDKTGNAIATISHSFNKFIVTNSKLINKHIDYDRDFLFSYFGFETLKKSYFLTLNKDVIERPQDVFMRAAIQIHIPSDHSEYRNPDVIKKIFNVYDHMSNKLYTHATPTLFNSGSNNAGLSSCFLLGSEDSLEGILKTLTDCCRISKGMGGIGLHFSMIREAGALIRKTNGKSSGIIPQMKMFNAGARAYDQGGGKRKGSWVFYLEPHHPDIFEFLRIRTNDGKDENQKCLDLFSALWISDLFMKRLLSNEMWSTFSPVDCQGLNEVWGDEYEQLYLKYESEGRAVKTFPAIDISHAIVESLKDAGIPYIMFKDNVNKVNMQNNLGTIKSSNLCVSGDTMILTDRGYYDIAFLTNQSEYHNIWNGEIFTIARFAKTGVNQELIEVEIDNGNRIKCTPYHKFIVIDNFKNERLIEARNLSVDDVIITTQFPTIDSALDFPHAYTHGVYAILGIAHATNAYKDIPCILGSHITSKLKDNITILKISENIIYLPKDLLKRNEVPINYSIKSKLAWLAGLLDSRWKEDRQYHPLLNLYIKSDNIDYLRQIQLLMNTLGTNPIICKDLKYAYNDDYNSYGLRISEYDVKQLIKLGIPLKLIKLGITDRKLTMPIINKIRSITRLFVTEDTYCFNEPIKNRGIFNGMLLGNCTEIIIHSDTQEYGTCNLASICLPEFVEDTYSEEELNEPENKRRELNHEFPVNPYFNYKKLVEIAGEITENINNVIDKTFNPTIESARGNFRHRPIGIGIQGLADVFLKFGVAFGSEKSRELNKNIAEAIYYGSVSYSSKMCRQIYLDAINKVKTTGIYKQHIYTSHVLKMYPALKSENLIAEYTDTESIPKNVGAYSSYASYKNNGASHMANGKFHWELSGISKDQLSGMFDWDTLRDHINTFGVRNSLFTAYMPTGTTSQIMGNSACIEPYVSNMYTKTTLAGTYTVVNKYLFKYLHDHGLYNEKINNFLLKNNGSIQNIEGIPDSIKILYRTVWEMPQKILLQMASERQPFIDQSQSMSLWFKDYSYDKFINVIGTGWKLGLKTCSYYTRTEAGADPEKFTISQDVQEELSIEETYRKQKQLESTSVKVEEEICVVCSA
jgi:ribonucleoside-diphosphate reductase alpha chain